MNTLHKLIYFGVLIWLLAACGTQPETATSNSDGASLFNAGVTIIDVSATPAPETAVTIIYVTATPQPTATTAPITDLPRVFSRQPTTQNITDRQPTITLRFNQTIDADSVAAALNIDPFLPTEVTVEGQIASIHLLQPLNFDTEYQFTLDNTIVNPAGQHATAPYTWKLNLKDTLSGIASPSSSNPTGPFTIRFNYPMDEASVNQALTIKPDISGKLAWSSSSQMLTFTPNERLEAETQYTLRFQGELRDRDGRNLPLPPDFSFTTSPSILSYTPKNSAVSPLSPIEIRFDRPMDEAAAEAAFQLEPLVDGTFSWFETTLRFKPTAGYLAENSQYTVTILPTALSADGEQIMDEELSWSFTTSAAEDVASFGYGPNAQVLDANGRRAVQFQANSQDIMPLGFELYRLTLEQFLDRYSSNFKNSWEEGDGNGEISTADTELVKSWQMETAVPITDYTNVQELIIPDDVTPGLYILNLTADRLNDQLILVLTENSLAVKQAEGQIMAWVTDINGTHVPGITVGVYARSGDRLAEGITNDEGVFRTELLAFEAGGPPAIEPLIVVAQNGDDMTVSGLSGDWQSSSGNHDWWGTPKIAHSAAFINTDRPIYKPGQLVYFKAIVRLDDDAILTVPPAGTPATVRIRDGRNNVVQTYDLITNDFGTVNDAFQLAEGAMLGDYSVEVELDGSSHRQTFKVEDYRKPDYEVTVTTDAGTYLLGDKIEVTVDTAYFFGEPVPNASVTIRRFNQDQYWGENGSPNSWYEEYEAAQNPITGRTDANGRLTLTLPIPRDTHLGNNYDYNYWDWGRSLKSGLWGIEATVDDGSHQTVSGFATVQLYDRSEWIEADTGSYVQEPGRPFIISADVKTIFDEPVANRGLMVQLARWNSSSYEYSTVVQTASLTTDSNGRASTPFTIEQPGFYKLHIVGADANGGDIHYSDYIYAFSDFYTDWVGSSNSALTVDVAEESYAPSETAQIIVESTFSGPALMTIERGTTRREQLVQLTAPLTVIDLPIEETDVPNIYVAINAWREQDQVVNEDTYESLPDGRLLTASTNVNVPANTKRLTVTITQDKAQYAPRQEATFTVRVTNYRGEPVSAELSLALVDEAIFALSPELSGLMYDAFYFERNNIVRTYNSLRPVRYLGGGGMGGGGGDEGPFAGGPRADFPDTAAWFPVLYTDFNGEAKVTIPLPDSLTSWRLTAKATTADTQVGEATANITTWQPIIVRPLLPRILTTGDTAVLSAIVHNYSPEMQTITVQLTIDNNQLTINTAPTQTVTIAPGESGIVGWPVEAKEAGEAEIGVTAVAQSGLQGDAIQLPLTIQPLAIPDVQTQVGQFSSQLRTTVNIPADALPMSTVEIQLSRSIAGTLLEGLEYLTGYPYGCVEQTMSKALPNAVVGRALNQLGVTNPTLQAELPAYINASVQRLYGFQHNDGGWGWWFDDATHDYQTAWVIFGLSQVAEAGYEVDPAVIERGTAWLNENLDGMDARTRAFALYALAEAGQPNADATLALANDPAALQGDEFGLAGLALALDALGEDEMAREIVDGLAETAVTTNNQTHWQGASHDGYYDSKTMASDVRSTALVLSAFTQIRPGHALEGDIVRWLMAQRRSQGWGSTNETSFAILGLTDHLLAAAFNETAANTGYTVSLDGAVIAEGTLGQGAPAVTVSIPQDQLTDGENEIVMEQDGERPLYYTINSRTYVAQKEIDAAGVIEIEREYLDPVTGKPLESIVPGQLVKVQLTVRLPENGSYMMVEDKLPGGLEALNEGLNTTSRAADEYGSMYGEDPYSWHELGYNYKEIFGDRVSFFITEMDTQKRIFTYMARATMEGEFSAMPAEATAMYNPALWGRSASDQLVITKGE